LISFPKRKENKPDYGMDSLTSATDGRITSVALVDLQRTIVEIEVRRERREEKERAKVIPVFLVENLFNLRPNIRVVRLATTEEEESDNVIIGRTDDKMKIINMLDNTNVEC